MTTPAPPRPLAASVDALVEAIRRGGTVEESYRQLTRLYYRPVQEFFSRRGFAPEECQDLTQETFLGIFRGIGGYRAEASFDAWAFAIAANVYRRRLRHAHAGLRLATTVPLPEAQGPEGAEAELADPGPEAGEQALASERARLLKAAVSGLPPQMRACLALRVYHDLKYREVAERMNLSVDTVKAHLFQARQRLKTELGEYFLGEEESS